MQRGYEVKPLPIDTDYLLDIFQKLIAIPSPSGFTDEAVRFTCEELGRLGIPFELTRRGGIRADMPGRQLSPDRAIVSHLDTIGAMVRRLKENGRLALVPIGTWSSRFIEGARVTVFTDGRTYRGTVLPVKAAGHVYDKEIDLLPVAWENVELRLDEPVFGTDDLEKLGIQVGDVVAVDPNCDITPSGFINSRHLDDKAGVATVLAAARAIGDNGITLSQNCHLLFTIAEEVGSGASSILHGDVAEMVTIDTGPAAPGQSTDEYGVTICFQDSSGPFDWHLSRQLAGLAARFGITHKRDIFNYYRCDSASALEAGNDIRTALVCFGTDATHGYERSHIRSLESLGMLLTLYMQSGPVASHDESEMGSLEGFPSLPIET
jgi:peptidase M42 family hydrolase